MTKAPSSRSIDGKLARTASMFTNALEYDEIAAALDSYGYSPEVVRQGLALHQRAAELNHIQNRELGEQVEATAATQAAWDAADAIYMPLVKATRVAFKDSIILHALALDGRRKESRTGWIAQASEFYARLLERPDLIEQLGRFKITRERVEDGHAKVAALVAAVARQSKESTEAEAAATARDAAIDELDDWVEDFIKIARLALAHNPQLLEGLGVPVRS